MHAIHTKACPNASTNPLPTQVSCDGVSECRSNSVSIDVYSTRMIGCKQVYPHLLVRPLSKTYKDETDHLRMLLDDIKENPFNVKHFVADNLKHAVAKNVLNHASLYPCEYCFQKGTRYKHGSNCRSKIVWPASSCNGEPRTTAKIKEIIDKIEADPNMPHDEKKGIVGNTPLMELPNFDVVKNSPAEYMHSVCSGVVKRMIELTFSVGANRPRQTKRKLSSTIEFNLCMLATKVPRESSRRSRELDLAVMKAQELRNIVLFYFPHVLQCIEPNAKERKAWILLAYMIKSCVIPSKEFAPIDLSVLEKACEEFYKIYEKLFGVYNCSYNTHVVCSHLIEIRADGPLTLTSAFGFESFYAEMRHAFTPGTQSTLKQIFEKVLLKRVISHHSCQNHIYFSEKDTPLECNSMIYVFKHNDYKMYKILKVEKEQLLCYPQGKFPCSFRETSGLNLNWSQIGVFKKGGVSNEPTIINKSDVSGKVIVVDDYLMTCPNDVLREK